MAKPPTGKAPRPSWRGLRRNAGLFLACLVCAASMAMPWQARSGEKQTENKADVQPAATFRGRLKSVDNKSITITLDENRELEFKRTSRTRFFKDGREIKNADFAPSSVLSVEGALDVFAVLTAQTVSWDKAAQTADPRARLDEPVVDAWAIDQPQVLAAQAKPQPAKPAAEDSGPPKLRRGAPADRSYEKSAPPPESSSQGTWVIPSTEPETAPAAAAGPDESEPARPPDRDDPVIRKAADAAMQYIESLPNYTTQQTITRYESRSARTEWKALDVVTADVVYENGKEQYRNVMVGGKKADDLRHTGGVWSTGEFGTMLISLFGPATQTEFRFSRSSRIAGINASVYSYKVSQQRSAWSIQQESKVYQPAYEGSVWIDPATFKVLRIEMAAVNLPRDFGLDKAESATDYDYVRLGSTERYLLPVHAETLACQRDTTNCYRNVIEFRNYHKYTSESTVTYDDPVVK